MILYKYLPEIRIELLEKKEIRFSQPEYLDDPFEAHPNLKGLYSLEALNTLGKPNYLDWKKNELPKILEDVGLGANKTLLQFYLTSEDLDYTFKSLYEQSVEAVYQLLASPEIGESKLLPTEIKKAINKRFGILCLAEEQDNSKMWSLYSSGFRGFVIGFEKEHAFFNQCNSPYFNIGCVKQVQYSLTRPKWTLFDTFEDYKKILNLIDHLFYLKENKWEDQKEWRLVLTLNKANKIINDEIYLFNFPSNCVKEVILGYKMENKNRVQIKKILSEDTSLSHIILKECSIDYINDKEVVIVKEI